MAQRKSTPKPAPKATKPAPKAPAKAAPKKVAAKVAPKPPKAPKPQTADELREDIALMMYLNPSYMNTVMATSQENVVAIMKKQRRTFQSANEETLPNYGVGKEPEIVEGDDSPHMGAEKP